MSMFIFPTKLQILIGVNKVDFILASLYFVWNCLKINSAYMYSLPTEMFYCNLFTIKKVGNVQKHCLCWWLFVQSRIFFCRILNTFKAISFSIVIFYIIKCQELKCCSYRCVSFATFLTFHLNRRKKYVFLYTKVGYLSKLSKGHDSVVCDF